MYEDMKSTVARIERSDRVLAKQLRRAACSVVLNIAEGEHSDAGDARERFRTARGSAAEARACIDAAGAFGLVEPLGGAEKSRLDGIVAVLTKLAR
jgi:four helix bundle protein